jgi:cysteine desulfurase
MKEGVKMKKDIKMKEITDMSKTMKVYLDNGATTMADPEVVKAMQPYFTEKYGNASSLHSFGNEAKNALNNSRAVIAKILNAEPEEIIFTSGGTESDNLAIIGTAFANKERGNHIITSRIEHPAVLRTCEYLEKNFGFKVTYLPVDKEGFVKIDELKKAMTDKTILVTIMHANNEIGTIEPIDEIGKLCKEKGITFHTDAVQSFTKVPIDVRKTNVDMISISAHKIHGPKGVGALYIRKGANIKPLAYGGSHEFRMRAGTENITGIVGFAKAAELNSMPEHAQYVAKLRDRLIKGVLKNIDEAIVNGPKDKTIKNRLCNNANIAFKYVEGESVLMHLDFRGIAVSTGSACSSKSLEPSHVLTSIGLEKKDSHGAIRFTMSRFNTELEIDYTIERLTEIIKKLRELSPLNKSTIGEFDKKKGGHCHI